MMGTLAKVHTFINYFYEARNLCSAFGPIVRCSPHGQHHSAAIIMRAHRMSSMLGTSSGDGQVRRPSGIQSSNSRVRISGLESKPTNQKTNKEAHDLAHNLIYEFDNLIHELVVCFSLI